MQQKKTNIEVAYQIAYSSTWALENRNPGKNSNLREEWYWDLAYLPVAWLYLILDTK